MARKFGGVSGSVAAALFALKASVSSNAQGVASNASAIAALGTPVRADAGQSFTSGMIAQVLANLGVTYSIGASGYINLFRLVILQWGGVSSGSGGNGTWTYPVTFPNAVFRVFAIATGSATTGVGTVIPAKTNSSASYTASGGGGNYNGPLDFFAIGY